MKVEKPFSTVIDVAEITWSVINHDDNTGC